jgi:hypothetical protein
MKYALINPKGRVIRTSDKEFKFTPEGMEAVELTNEQAGQVEASNEPLFLIEGDLLTRKAKLWKEQPEAVKELLRPERNRLLSGSDWTQLNDTTIPEDKLAAWAAYRQDLRDLTDDIDENGEVEFPVAP